MDHLRDEPISEKVLQALRFRKGRNRHGFYYTRRDVPGIRLQIVEGLEFNVIGLSKPLHSTHYCVIYRRNGDEYTKDLEAPQLRTAQEIQDYLNKDEVTE